MSTERERSGVHFWTQVSDHMDLLGAIRSNSFGWTVLRELHVPARGVTAAHWMLEIEDPAAPVAAEGKVIWPQFVRNADGTVSVSNYGIPPDPHDVIMLGPGRDEAGLFDGLGEKLMWDKAEKAAADRNRCLDGEPTYEGVTGEFGDSAHTWRFKTKPLATGGFIKHPGPAIVGESNKESRGDHDGD